MNTFVRLQILILFFLFTGPGIGLAQRFAQNDKIHFSDSIRTIKLWTYIVGDTSFRRYVEAVKSARFELNKKGYTVEVVVYKKGQNFSAQEWKNKTILELKKNEAFLEIPTQVKKYEVNVPSGPPTSVMLNSTGAVVYSIDYRNIDSLQTKYYCKASSMLYVNRNIPSRTPLVPFYSRSQELKSGNIDQAVKYSLGGIPSSKHPPEKFSSFENSSNTKVPIEITAFGGYTFASKMNVLEENGSNTLYNAKFSGNAQYGLEIGIGLSKNLDVTIQYRRVNTIVDINTPKRKDAGSLSMNQNYLLLGLDYNIRVSKVISPYAGIRLGALNITPVDNYFRDVWYFAAGIQVGSKFYLSKRVGLRVQADLLYQIHPVKAPFLYSDDVYQNVPIDAMSNMPQLGLSAGIFLRIGN